MTRASLWLAALMGAIGLGWIACDGDSAGGGGDTHVVETTVVDTGAGEVTPDPASLLRVATYNVERFFDTTCDSGRCDGNSFEVVPTKAAFSARADQIVGAIRGLEVDVLLIQEIENQACVDALTDRLGDELRHDVLGESGWSASLDVAILTRFPVTRVVTHQDDPIPHPIGGTTWFTREFLEVHLDVAGRRVIVFNAHFKSKFDDDPYRRLAEAMAARAIIDDAAAAHPDAVVLFGGDLNDVPGSLPLNVLEKDGGLFRVASTMSPGLDWTIRYAGDALAIDHLYIHESHRDAFVDDSVRVLRGRFEGWGGSDHAALRALFSIEPSSAPSSAPP